MEELDVIYNVFTPAEQEVYDNVTANAIDIDNLMKTGEISIKKEEIDGICYKTVDYDAFDGKTGFTKVQSYPVEEENKYRALELIELTDMCIAREDYEAATNYRNKLAELGR